MQVQHVFDDLKEVIQSDEHGSEEKEDAYRWRSGWRDMCSEWFVLMLNNHVQHAHHEATAFVIDCKKTTAYFLSP